MLYFKHMMKIKNSLCALAFLIFFGILVIGCSQPIEKAPIGPEEVVDTGVLVIESSPSSAQVYVDGELRGDTPFNLYNIATGPHNVAVKKEGYIDFEKTVTIKVGRTEEIDVTLTSLKIVEEIKPIEEQMPEGIPAKAPKQNKLNLSSFALYYDFDKMLFSEIRTEQSDIFSRKYDKYVDFIAFVPVKIVILDKPINDVKKEDCVFTENVIATLYSGQTLCVKTLEDFTVAVGGSWDAMPNELEWMLLN